MDMKVKANEGKLYEPVKEAATKLFAPGSEETHLEITARTGPSDQLKEHLPDYSIFLLSSQKFKPDIMGYLRWRAVKVPGGGTLRRRTSNVVIEVKSGGLTFKDIYQIKGYAEVYNADYALLVSDEKMPELVRRVLNLRPQLLNTSALMGGRIKIAQFNLQEGGFNKRAWYPDEPGL